LKSDVKADWTAFHSTAKSNAVRTRVHDHVVTALHGLLADNRKKEKKEALRQQRAALGELPLISKTMIGKFIDEVQVRCPTFTPRDLNRTVEIYTKLEQTRTGYDLLRQLAACAPADLDKWNEIMTRWTADHAALVLNELERRLTLIGQLQRLIRDKRADEVHELQPLFERGLWIFGPEYEAVDFRANRGMAEVIRNFLGVKGAQVSRNRMDFIALPDSSIGVYGADAYDTNGEVQGIRKVLIVELKRGGFEIGQDELDQARKYVRELRRLGAVSKDTEVLAFVLGASLDFGLEVNKIGERSETVIMPMIYDVVLNRAHARTFNLQRRVEALEASATTDPEVEEVLAFPITEPLYDAGLRPA
jgi:hypothetical protein